MKSFLSFALLAALALSSPAAPAADWGPASTAAALAAAGPNASELSRALREGPETQRDAMQFLIDNMPPPDPASLKADFLLGHVADTDASIAVAPWASYIPYDIFLHHVLPYAPLNERRDHGRRQVRDTAAPPVIAALGILTHRGTLCLTASTPRRTDCTWLERGLCLDGVLDGYCSLTH